MYFSVTKNILLLIFHSKLTICIFNSFIFAPFLLFFLHNFLLLKDSKKDSKEQENKQSTSENTSGNSEENESGINPLLVAGGTVLAVSGGYVIYLVGKKKKKEE